MHVCDAFLEFQVSIAQDAWLLRHHGIDSRSERIRVFKAGSLRDMKDSEPPLSPITVYTLLFRRLDEGRRRITTTSNLLLQIRRPRKLLQQASAPGQLIHVGTVSLHIYHYQFKISHHMSLQAISSISAEHWLGVYYFIIVYSSPPPLQIPDKNMHQKINWTHTNIFEKKQKHCEWLKPFKMNQNDGKKSTNVYTAMDARNQSQMRLGHRCRLASQLMWWSSIWHAILTRHIIYKERSLIIMVMKNDSLNEQIQVSFEIEPQRESSSDQVHDRKGDAAGMTRQNGTFRYVVKFVVVALLSTSFGHVFATRLVGRCSVSPLPPPTHGYPYCS